jgi:hypothetical protein
MLSITELSSNLCRAAAMVLALSPRTALAIDGAELLQNCESQEAGRSIYCRGYVAGIADTAREKAMACPADTASDSDLRDVALKYLHEHPESRQYGAASVVAMALAQAFPCSRP